MWVALRADGGPAAGLGHLGRCAALAQAFRKLGHDTRFIDVPSSCRPWLSRLGFKTARTSERVWDLLVADSYRFSASDWRLLRRQGRSLLAFDDTGTVSAPCDWVLNGNAYGSEIRYAADRGARLLLGPKYLPLRREYWRRPKGRKTFARLHRVLITFGGGDGWSLAATAARAAAKALPEAEIHAVTGPLRHAKSADARIVWHRAPKSLKPLLESCDLAVCGGGQTLYEAAFTGAPILTVTLADNQRLNVKSLCRRGAALPLGRPDKKFTARLALALKKMDQNTALRRKMSQAGRKLVDGRGALRVARLLS